MADETPPPHLFLAGSPEPDPVIKDEEPDPAVVSLLHRLSPVAQRRAGIVAILREIELIDESTHQSIAMIKSISGVTEAKLDAIVKNIAEASASRLRVDQVDQADQAVTQARVDNFVGRQVTSVASAPRAKTKTDPWLVVAVLGGATIGVVATLWLFSKRRRAEASDAEALLW